MKRSFSVAIAMVILMLAPAQAVASAQNNPYFAHPPKTVVAHVGQIKVVHIVNKRKLAATGESWTISGPTWHANCALQGYNTNDGTIRFKASKKIKHCVVRYTARYTLSGKTLRHAGYTHGTFNVVVK